MAKSYPKEFRADVVRDGSAKLIGGIVVRTPGTTDQPVLNENLKHGRSRNGLVRVANVRRAIARDGDRPAYVVTPS